MSEEKLLQILEQAVAGDAEAKDIFVAFMQKDGVSEKTLLKVTEFSEKGSDVAKEILDAYAKRDF